MMRRLFALFFLLTTQLEVSVSFAADELIAPPSQFPLHLLHLNLRPQTAEVTAARTVETSLGWTNTFNSKRQAYRIDAETAIFEAAYRAPLDAATEASLRIPLLHRGGGVLDQPIGEYDSFIGFPNERREQARRDFFQLFGVKNDGTRFNITQSGSSIGNTVAGVKRALFSEDGAHIAASLDLSLPTTTQATFGHQGIDAQAAVMLTKSTGPLTLHTGVSTIRIGDREIADICYDRFASSGYLYLDYAWDRLSLFLGMLGGTEPTRGIRGMPEGWGVLDTGARYRVSDQFEMSFLLRENPIHPDRSPDVTFFLSAVTNVE